MRIRFNTLFIKIFLWFWLTTIAVVIVAVWTTARLYDQLAPDAIRTHFEQTQSAYAEAANAILITGGIDALGRWLSQLKGRGGAPGRQMILDDNGESIFGPPPSEEIRSAVSVAATSVSQPAPMPRLFYDPIYDNSGDRYWFVSDMRFHDRPSRPHRFKDGPRREGFAGQGPPIALIRILIALIVSAAICYGLATYITRPIRRLQQATEEIASGNFRERITRDISPRGDELGALSRDFDRMSERLENLQAAQNALIRDISHELRSPLARLQVALALAQQRGNGDTAAELTRIEVELNVLDELIGKLLSVARLETTSDLVKKSPLNLRELIEGIVRDAAFEASERGVAVTLSADSDPIVNGDLSLLKSAIENVIRNAIRHTSDETVVLVSLVEDKTKREVLISVRDHGPGVPEQMLDDLFKPFVRADYARDRDSGGHGVGLAITSAAVQRHSGTVRAYNHEIAGLVVEIRLPSN